MRLFDVYPGGRREPLPKDFPWCLSLEEAEKRFPELSGGNSPDRAPSGEEESCDCPSEDSGPIVSR